jgi:hypothetical protein
MVRNSIHHCVVVPLPKIHNRAGNISVIEGESTLPFRTRRIFYLYDIPGGESRGGHAHRQLYQFIVAASGSFNLLLDDGKNKKIVNLNRPDYGVLVLPGIWGELMEFSSGAICLVMASEPFDEKDYIRDYEEFKSLAYAFDSSDR